MKIEFDKYMPRHNVAPKGEILEECFWGTRTPVSSSLPANKGDKVVNIYS
jgi:hypothetical protein